MKGSKIPTYRKTALSTKGHANHPKKKITDRYHNVYYIKPKLIKPNIVSMNIVLT